MDTKKHQMYLTELNKDYCSFLKDDPVLRDFATSIGKIKEFDTVETYFPEISLLDYNKLFQEDFNNILLYAHHLIISHSIQTPNFGRIGEDLVTYNEFLRQIVINSSLSIKLKTIVVVILENNEEYLEYQNPVLSNLLINPEALNQKELQINYKYTIGCSREWDIEFLSLHIATFYEDLLKEHYYKNIKENVRVTEITRMVVATLLWNEAPEGYLKKKYKRESARLIRKLDNEI